MNKVNSAKVVIIRARTRAGMVARPDAMLTLVIVPIARNHVIMVTVAIVVGSNTPKHPLKVSIVRMTNQQMHNGSSAKALMDASMGVRNANAVMAAITVHPQVICHDVIRVVLMKSVAGKSSRITPVLPPQIKVKVTKKLLSVTKKSVVF